MRPLRLKLRFKYPGAFTREGYYKSEYIEIGYRCCENSKWNLDVWLENEDHLEAYCSGFYKEAEIKGKLRNLQSRIETLEDKIGVKNGE